MKDIIKIQEIMADFADRTGLTANGTTPKRYVWTDAFAVCNYLGLFLETAEERYLQDALALVEQVHDVLGKYRDTDSRKGWISSLDEEEGKRHPTVGGLRIGKSSMNDNLMSTLTTGWNGIGTDNIFIT